MSWIYLGYRRSLWTTPSRSLRSPPIRSALDDDNPIIGWLSSLDNRIAVLTGCQWWGCRWVFVDMSATFHDSSRTQGIVSRKLCRRSTCASYTVPLARRWVTPSISCHGVRASSPGLNLANKSEASAAQWPFRSFCDICSLGKQSSACVRISSRIRTANVWALTGSSVKVGVG